MRSDLPNLDWLRVFAATAATESFVLAADQLGVTPGAVSQRIKSLETFLGFPLFQRHAQRVRLTDAGRRYSQRILPALEQLSTATHEIRSADLSKPVRLTILPAFAQLWLGPRLDRFHAQQQSARIEVWADPAVVDLQTSDFDIAIRYGRPPFAAREARRLLFDQLVPVISPALAPSITFDSLGLPVDVPLMVDTYWASDLDEWLKGAGGARPASLVTQTFSLYSMALEATLKGRGFTIGHTALIGDLIARAELLPLTETRVDAPNQFHLLTRPNAAPSQMAEEFIAWILDEAESENG
jgi:LysR family transcriptional regulator, glycine cleavage system transcriptional activator